MSAITEWHDGVSWVDISDRVPLEGWQLREDAEEGSNPTSSIAESDAALDFVPRGHRPFRVREPDSEADDDLVYQGFTWNDDTGRGQAGSTEFEPLARAITEQTGDANTIWQRPVMLGADCNRPSETDVARVQWLLGTNEFAILDDVTTYVHTGSTHTMDANDYRGQSGDQVMRDCGQESGKNWWAKYIGNGSTRPLSVWYGRDSNSTYDSPLFLTNDPTQWSEDELAADTSVVWPGQDWKVSRDYSRIYCGIYAQYSGGATFRHDTTTHTAYFGDPGPDSHRVMVVPMPNVHTLARAQARADRMLADIEDPDIHVTTTVRLSAAKVTKLRAGMRVPIYLTNEPEFDDWKWCRIVNATVTPVAAGTMYDVAIEATPTGPPDSSGPPAPDHDGDVFAGLQSSTILVDDGTGHGTLGYGGTYDAGLGGWPTIPITGPIAVVQSVPAFYSITVSEPMTVRIDAVANYSDNPLHATKTFNLRVNGAVIYTASSSLGSDTFGTVVYGYHLDAGDVVSVDGSDHTFWTGSTNITRLIVGRGTYNLAGEIWTGP